MYWIHDFRPHGWPIEQVITRKQLRKVLLNSGIRSYLYDRGRLCNESAVHIYSGDNHLLLGLTEVCFVLPHNLQMGTRMVQSVHYFVRL